jgi:hypothetical protein
MVISIHKKKQTSRQWNHRLRDPKLAVSENKSPSNPADDMFSQQQRLGGRVAHSLLQLTTTAKASPKRRSCSRPAIMLCIDMSSSNLEQQGLRIQELGRSKHWGESLTLIDPRYRQTTVGSTHLLQLPSTSRDQAIGERASP